MPRTFRVKDGSKLAELTEHVLEMEGDITQERLREEGFGWTEITSLWHLGKMSDNFTIGITGASYVDVTPSTIIHQADSVQADGLTAAPKRAAQDGPVIHWPDVPTISDPMSNFIKPSWYDRMAIMVGKGRHISLAGPPGIGKSTAVEQLAIEHHKPLVNIPGDVGLRRRHLSGHQMVNGGNYIVAEYAAAAVHGWWAKIDEANAAEADALMFLNSQMAPPFTVSYYGRTRPVHPDFRLFITYNPNLIGTKPLPPAFKDRFFPIALKFPTARQLKRLLVANGMPPDDVTNADVGVPFVYYREAILKYGAAAWSEHMRGRMRYQITPRRLMDAVTLTLAGVDVFEALEAAVVDAVDNIAEARVLKDLISRVKSDTTFGHEVND